MESPATPQPLLRKLSRLGPPSASSSSATPQNLNESSDSPSFSPPPKPNFRRPPAPEASTMGTDPPATTTVTPVLADSPALRALFAESAPRQVEALTESGPQIVVITEEYEIFASEMERKKSEIPIRIVDAPIDEMELEAGEGLSVVEVYEQLAAERFNVLATDFQLKPLDNFALEAERQNWELERNTWNLVSRLFGLRLLTSFPSSVPPPPPNPYLSDNALLTHHLNNSLQHSTDLAVLQWLQETAPDSSLRDGPDEGRSRWWGGTVDALKRKGGLTTTSLDPDSPLRGGLALNQADAALDGKTNRALFGMVRRGAMEGVAAICGTQAADWRAASLCGSRVYGEELEESGLDEGGNRNRDLWKAMCWEVAREASYDKYERALYASMCGDIQNILDVCETWEDHLWAYYTSLTEMTATQVLRKYPLPPLPAPVSDFLTPVILDSLTPADIFDRVSRLFANRRVPLAISGWHRIQQHLILDRLPELFSEIVRETREEEEEAIRSLQSGRQPVARTSYLHPHMLRFLTHLALVIRQCVSAGLMTWDRIGDLEHVIVVYAGLMIKAKKRTIYPTLLETIQQPAAVRHAYLELATKFGMDAKNLAQTLLVNGFQDGVMRIPLPSSASEVEVRASDVLGHVEDVEQKEVRLLEWLDWKAGWWAEKVQAVNFLMRRWLLQGNLAAARHLLVTHVANPPPLPDGVKVTSLGAVSHDKRLMWETAQVFEMAEEKVLVDGILKLAEWKKKMAEKPRGGIRGLELLDENAFVDWKNEVSKISAAVVKGLRSFVFTRLLEVEEGWRKLDEHALVREVALLREIYVPESVLWLMEVLYETRDIFPNAIDEANEIIMEASDSNDKRGHPIADILKRNRTLASRVSKVHPEPLKGEVGWNEASNAELNYWDLFENWVRLFAVPATSSVKVKDKASSPKSSPRGSLSRLIAPLQGSVQQHSVGLADSHEITPLPATPISPILGRSTQFANPKVLFGNLGKSTTVNTQPPNAITLVNPPSPAHTPTVINGSTGYFAQPLNILPGSSSPTSVHDGSHRSRTPSLRSVPLVSKPRPREILEELIPVQRYESSKYTIKGSFLVEEPGDYLLVFDNTFSLSTSKKVNYFVAIKEIGWAKRYLVLDSSGKLTYYEHPGSTLRGVMRMSETVIVVEQEKREISLDDGTTIMHLKSPVPAEFFRWATALQTYEHRVRHRSSVAPSPSPEPRVSNGDIQGLFIPARSLDAKTSGTVERLHVAPPSSGESTPHINSGVPSLTIDMTGPPLSATLFSSASDDVGRMGREWSEVKSKVEELGFLIRGFRTESGPVTSQPTNIRDLLHRLQGISDSLQTSIPTLHVAFHHLETALFNAVSDHNVMRRAQNLDLVSTQKYLVNAVRPASIYSTGTSDEEFFDALQGSVIVVDDENEDEGDPDDAEQDETQDTSEQQFDELETSSGSSSRGEVSQASDALSEVAVNKFREATLVASRSQQPPIGLQVIRRTVLPSTGAPESPVSMLSILRRNVGKDLSTVSMPVALNAPLSILQCLAEELEYAQVLERAAEAADPVNRIMLVAAFACSTYANTLFRAGRKPFNPLLGETYELVRSDKGFRFIAEKVSHQP
ncbi:Nucleoporin nup84 [Gonapodya sp. JEL0774]|nr:Nucleoporin nup84 [Gonapodya sp. JEL0774]